MNLLRSFTAVLQTLKVRLAVASAAVVVAALAMLASTLLGAFEADFIHRAVIVQRDTANRVALQIGERIDDRLDALAALARLVPAGIHGDPDQALALLIAKPAPQRLFQTLFVATPDGEIVARWEDGVASKAPLGIGDRPYFKRMVATAGPVVSGAVTSRAGGHPVVVMLHPLRDRGGGPSTVVGATIALDGPSGLNNVGRGRSPFSRTVIVDTAGHIVGHDSPHLLLTEAAALPELQRFYESHRNRLRGDDSSGAVRVDDRVIGWASIPQTRWYLLETTPLDELDTAMRVAEWKALISGAVLAALGGGAIFVVCIYLFWRMNQLRDRAMRVLTETVDIEAGWPTGDDEIGELSRVFRHILRERLTAEQMGHKMLAQLQAILDNASVGIAFTRHERFELVSPSLASLTGYSRYELFGKPMSLLAVSEGKYRALRRYLYSRGGRFDLEFPVRRKDGSDVWVRVVGSTIEEGSPDTGTIWIVEDVSEARRMREQLSWNASRDPLTELLNRREFEARVRRHLESPDRAAAAIMFLDLDRFKQVNDTGGHAAGDRLLCDLARLLEMQVRQSDRVARLGGDEFAVLLIGCSPEKAIEIAERVRHAVRAYRLELDGTVHSVGVSIGLVSIVDATMTLADAMQAADAACYEVKRSGRDSVRVWGATPERGTTGTASTPGLPIV